MTQAHTPLTPQLTNDHHYDVHLNLPQQVEIVRNRSTVAMFCSELAGTWIFVFMSLMNISIYSLYPAQLNWTGVALSWGVNLFIGIKVAETHANAYLNPCIALADAVWGKLSTKDLIIHTAAEMIGAFLAAALTYVLNYSTFQRATIVQQCAGFATGQGLGVSKTEAFFVEFVGTALLSYTIFKIPTYIYKPVCIAAMLSAIVLSMGYQSAFSLNWARDFGPRLFITMVHPDCFNIEYAWVPLVADYAGAILGAGLAALHPL